MKADPGQVIGEIETLAEVENVVHTGSLDDWAAIDIHCHANVDIREQLFSLAREQNWPLRELYRDTASLEDAFVDLTSQ